MEESKKRRYEIDGLKQYTAVIRNDDGSPAIATEFSDWFIDDDAARIGFVEILREQGYGVASVEIGFPCVVTLKSVLSFNGVSSNMACHSEVPPPL